MYRNKLSKEDTIKIRQAAINGEVSKLVNQIQVQAQKGYKIYLSSPKTKDSYTRMDIVVGNDNVAISFLLRSVWDKNFKRIGTKDGSPNIVLNTMCIKPTDHGIEIQLGAGNGDIYIEDTHDSIYKEKNLRTIRRKRINKSKSKGIKPPNFEERNNLQWNFCAE
jgi:ribosome-associated translation inhibitor RaiA